MSQLHFYVDAQVEAELRRRAQAAGVPLSRYLAEVVRRDIGGGYPAGFWETVYGGWAGEPLRRPEQGAWEERDMLWINESERNR